MEPEGSHDDDQLDWALDYLLSDCSGLYPFWLLDGLLQRIVERHLMNACHEPAATGAQDRPMGSAVSRSLPARTHQPSRFSRTLAARQRAEIRRP